MLDLSQAPRLCFDFTIDGQRTRCFLTPDRRESFPAYVAKSGGEVHSITETTVAGAAEASGLLAILGVKS